MRWVLLLALSWLDPVQAADPPLKLKLGTLAPNGSSYHKSLQVMGERWRKASGGAVQLIIFPGGTQGGEADMVGLMQTGNLDAGLLTATGLSEIAQEVTALQVMPLFFHNLAEVDYVAEKLRPQLDARLLAKGYIVLYWGDSGWVRFFTKTPVLHPDELRKLKVFTWAGDAHGHDLWKSSGFNPVSLETTAIPQAILSGTITALPTVPVYVLASQLDAQLKYMLEINWGPLVGAAVVRQKSWDRIPAATRQEMLAIAAEIGKKVTTDGRAENEASVAAMIKRGLQVQKVSPEVEAEWWAIIEKVQDKIRGKIVPADVFDETQRVIKEYRSRARAEPK